MTPEERDMGWHLLLLRMQAGEVPRAHHRQRIARFIHALAGKGALAHRLQVHVLAADPHRAWVLA